MNYPLKSSNLENRRRNTRQRVLLIIICLLIISGLFVLRPVRQVFLNLTTPFWNLKNSASNSNFFEYFKSKQALINERQAMEQKLFLAGNLLALNETLQSENETLKDLMGRSATKQKTILANILVKPPQSFYDLLVIDVGADEGIKVNDRVIADATVYIGKVSEVYDHTAKVTLYSSPGEKNQVILGTNSVSVEAIGVGGGNFNILLPREVEVKENDVIIMPSITTNIFGIVEKVDFKDKDAFQTVLFKSPVNISELSLVQVVLDK